MIFVCRVFCMQNFVLCDLKFLINISKASKASDLIQYLYTSRYTIILCAWGTECLSTKFPMPTMLYTGYSVKLQYLPTRHFAY